MAKAKKVQGAKATRARKPKAGKARGAAASGVTLESLTLDLEGEKDVGTYSKVLFRLFRFDTFAERITHVALRDPKSGAWEYVAVDDRLGEAVADVLSPGPCPPMESAVAACSGNGVTDEEPSAFSPHFVGKAWAGRDDPLSDCVHKSRSGFFGKWVRCWDWDETKEDCKVDAVNVAHIVDPRCAGSGRTHLGGGAFRFVCDLVSYPRIDYWMRDLHLKLAVGCMTSEDIFDPIFENAVRSFYATADWFGRRTGCRAEAEEVIACVGTVVKWLEGESSLSEDAFRKLRGRVFDCGEAMRKMAGAVLSKHDAGKATEGKPGKRGKHGRDTAYTGVRARNAEIRKFYDDHKKGRESYHEFWERCQNESLEISGESMELAAACINEKAFVEMCKNGRRTISRRKVKQG